MGNKPVSQANLPPHEFSLSFKKRKKKGQLNSRVARVAAQEQGKDVCSTCEQNIPGSLPAK